MNVPITETPSKLLDTHQLSQVSGGTINDIFTPYLLLVPRNNNELEKLLVHQFDNIAR